MNTENILKYGDKIKASGYDIIESSNVKYIVDEDKVKHSFTEFLLALLEYMIDNNVSDIHIIVNYMSFMVGERIGGVLFPVPYEKYKPYLLSWLEYKGNIIFGNDKDYKKNIKNYIEENMVYYELFFKTNIKKDGGLKINYDDLSTDYKNIIKKIVNNKGNVDLIGKKWFIQFLNQLNRGTNHIIGAKDLLNFQSLRYTLYRLEKDGKYKDYDYRLQLAPVTNFHGLFNVTIRLLTTKLLTIDKLGYDEYLPIIKDKVGTKKMHLLCGETNSGKSTSILGIEKYLVDSGREEGKEYKVIRIEDPIEKKVEWAEQIEVDYYPANPDEKRTFSDAVRSAMREDPDIIVVGEIRDLDTGDESLSASITGHIVLSTIHINNSFAIFKRMKSLKNASGNGDGGSGIDEQKILNGLGLVITTDLLTTYKLEDTISLKDLIRKKEGDKNNIYETYYKKLDNPLLKEIYDLLVELYKTKTITQKYPLLTSLFNEFKRFYPFYLNNNYIDVDNKKDFFNNFNKFILTTIKNFRIPFGKISPDRIGRRPVMEVLNMNSDLITQIQLQRQGVNSDLYEWLKVNEKTFLPRFYFAYIKNLQMLKQQETFNFLDIAKLATMGYVFNV